MSVHTDRAKAIAEQRGAFAGNVAAAPLWDLSKRELIEVCIRLGGLAGGNPDSAKVGAVVAMEEFKTLRDAKIV